MSQTAYLCRAVCCRLFNLIMFYKTCDKVSMSNVAIKCSQADNIFRKIAYIIGFLLNYLL